MQIIQIAASFRGLEMLLIAKGFRPDVILANDNRCVYGTRCSIGSANDNDEVVSRICGLTHGLGYNQAKTKMLLGRWAKDLLGLERSLLNEMDGSSEESTILLPRTRNGELRPPRVPIFRTIDS